VTLHISVSEMVRVPLCRPTPSLKACSEQEVLFENEVLRSSLPFFPSSICRPSLEEKHLLWASFSCRKDCPESPPELVKSDTGDESALEVLHESSSECMKIRRTSQDLQIETDSSPTKQDLSGMRPFPNPPTAPREKSLSPKDIKEIKRTASKELGRQNTTAETESPISQPPTPPTVPRTSQAPRYRKRLMSPPDMSNTLNLYEAASTQKTHTDTCVIAGDFRQCPIHFWDELQSKFSSNAACNPQTVDDELSELCETPKDDELSETWKRFEKRKLERKARSRCRNKSRAVIDKQGLSCSSTYEQRLCGLMASKLAQPAEAFSYRRVTVDEDSMAAPQTERTAFRRWS